MTPGSFTISHTEIFQKRAAAILARPDELCPTSLDASLLNNLPAIVSNAPSLSEIRMLKRSQLIRLLHSWIYIQSQDQSAGIEDNTQIKLNLEFILIKRISPALLQHVWSCYQYYPYITGFTDFLLKLSQKTKAKGERFFLFFLSELAEDKNKTKPLEALLELSVSPDADTIRESFWQTEQFAIQYPLVNSYARKLFPDSKQTANLDELKKRPLCSLLTALDIIPDTPFLLEFLSRYFITGDDQQLLDNKNIWLYTLNNSDNVRRLAIMQSYLKSFRLDNVWLDFNRAIERILTSTDLIDQLDHKARKHFEQWQLIDRINQHSGGQERKQLFYRDFFLHLREIVDWNENIKIVELTDFVLADNNEEPELLWFIDNNTYELLTEGEHTNILYFENNRIIPTARDISLNHSGENIVKLKLDEVNILYARDFIKQKLKKNNKKSQ